MTSKKASWKMVALLAATATAGYVCRVNISVAGVFLMDEFKLSEIELGRIFSVFLLGYAFFQVPSGLLADKFGARRVLLYAACLWVLFTGAMALVGRAPFLLGSTAAELTVFLGLRLLLGVAEAPVYVASAKGVSRWVPAPFHARANGIILSSIGIGSALATGIVTVTMVQWGWRIALLASALPALLMALLWIRTPEPEVVDAAPIEKDKINAPGSLRSVSFVLLTLSYSLQGYVGYIFISWFFTYLIKVRHVDIQSGAIYSVISSLLTVVSIPLGGFIMDKLIGGRLGPVWGRRLIPMVGLMASGVLISIGARTENSILAALTLSIATALILSVEGPFWATMQNIAGAKSGAGGGIMNMGCNIAGLLSPALTPVLASVVGWENTFHLAAVLAVVGGFLWLGIRPAAVLDERQGRPG